LIVVKIDFKSERSQRQIGYLALIGGCVAITDGFFGLWMQGRTMYEGDSLLSIADSLCPEDIYLSVCLTSLVISMGILSLAWAILASKLTEKFSVTKRNIMFAAFAVVCLVVIMVVSKIATDQDWARAKVAEDEYFKKMQTNTPASSPVKSQKTRQ